MTLTERAACAALLMYVGNAALDLAIAGMVRADFSGGWMALHVPTFCFGMFVLVRGVRHFIEVLFFKETNDD